jgi:hypothetical protein
VIVSAKKDPPAPGSYRFVLRKIAEHDPDIEENVTGYDESAYSRNILHADGKRRRTVFISSEYFRDRLTKLGWENVTGMWDGSAPAPAQAATAGPHAPEAAKRKAPVRIAG